MAAESPADAGSRDERPATKFTGYTRARKTRRSVLFADRLSKLFITLGGIGTIIAVLGISVFLVWVVVPLFLPAKIENLEGVRDGKSGIAHVAVDEFKLLGWVLLSDGGIEVFRLDNGDVRNREQLFPPGRLLASSFLISGDLAAFGLDDGTVRLAEIGFDSDILNAEDLPEAVVAALESDPSAPVDYENGVVELTPQRQYRVQRLRVERGSETRISNGPVHRVTHAEGPDGPLIVALAEGAMPEAAAAKDLVTDKATSQDAGPEEPAPEDVVVEAAASRPLRLVAIAGQETSNFLTGGTTLEFADPVDIPFEPLADGLPSHLGIAGGGSQVYVAWQDGSLLRIERAAEPYVAERGFLVAEGRTLRRLGFVLGNVTMIIGDSGGGVDGWFAVPAEGFSGEGLRHRRRDERTPRTLARTKELSRGGAAAISLASSARSRLILSGFADGEIRLYNVTNATELRAFRLPVDEPVLHLAMAPKEDGLLAVTPSHVYRADLDPRHPEASSKALFRPVWYEGYNQPQHTWQSSSGTDDFEMKLGLWPLIFGTLKATFYSLLFGAPLALLAALYTSEFLHHRVKGIVKPGIELMASLPSVVLGFLAALVFAPYVERAVPAALAVFIGIPVAFLAGAYLWQLLPVEISVRYGRWRFLLMVLALAPGLWLALELGPMAEAWFFGDDMKGWLAWEPGTEGAERFASSTGGWMILWLPVSGLLVALGLGRLVDPKMRRHSARWSRRTYALVDLTRFALSLAVTVLLAFAVSMLLDRLGFDPRGSYIDTYVPRNALIVGFVMGFAIIPIIYTISEDALSTVPEHLRSASLGAGATTWQTAVRIVIPTAMSGLFSAMMVGLGRAVGETMIVLMAAGNTPVLDWNVMNGFRTLSANIAVELPEAVRNSTHYRTLFLAALVLFVMTFAVNTVAEVIRLRFRRRAYQL